MQPPDSRGATLALPPIGEAADLMCYIYKRHKYVLAAPRKRGFLTTSRERGPDRLFARSEQGLFLGDAGLEFPCQIGDVGRIEGRVGLEHFVDGSEKVRESSDGREGLLAGTAVAVSDACQNERGIDNA